MIMNPYHQKRQLLLQSPDQQSAYDTAILCGKYIKNRATSLSAKALKSTCAAASSFASLTHRHANSAPANNAKSAQAVTAYLHGIRGFAAVIVYIFHATWAHSGIVEFGYGVDEKNLRTIQLPIIRLIHGGHAMVALFFLIGGYVNAAKPLQLIRSHRYSELTTNVGSSLLRRVFRLCLPFIAATLITALMTYGGLLEPSRRNIKTTKGVFYWPDFHPAQNNSLWSTLLDWRSQMIQLLDLWHQPFYTHLDPHLWTVPLELRASLVLSVSLAAVAACRVGPRLLILGLLAAFSVSSDRWEVALFLVGAILAELDIMRREKSKSMTSELTLGIDGSEKYDADVGIAVGHAARTRAQLLAGLGISVMALTGLHLLSYPANRGRETPGFVTISEWLIPYWTTDGKRYVHGTGGVLFLVATSCSKTLQQPFLTPAAQYLGTISYALYIVHGPLLHTIGYRLSPALLTITGVETGTGQATILILAGLLNFIIVLGVADIFYRFVDKGSVKVAVKFQQLCSTATN